MARINWLDEETDVPAFDEHVQQLEHFTNSLADGVVDAAELAKQSEAVVAAIKAVQDDLSDAQHEKVTRLLVELTAFNIMQTLHELTGGRVRKVVESS